MASNFSSGSELSQELFNKGIGYFGFEERLEFDVLDTTNKWTEVVTGTGATSLTGIFITVSTGATSGSTSSLAVNQEVRVLPTELTGDMRFKKFHLEFLLNGKFDNIDETETFIGLTYGRNEGRTSAAIVGVGIEGGNIYAIINGPAISEQKTQIGVGTIGLIKITVDQYGYHFSVNGVLTKSYLYSEFVVSPVYYVSAKIKNSIAENNYIYFARLSYWYEE